MDYSKSPLATSFKSKKPLLTTPIKNTNQNSASVDPTAVITPERVNPYPNTRVRNQSFALSISDVRRKAQQLRQKPENFGSNLPKAAPVELLGSRLTQKATACGKSAPLLSDRLEMLCEFFNAMISSIQLLRFKKLPRTFSRLARNVESLTDRRFTLHNLAQLKYIMQEVIVLKKVRVLDEATSCMKEEIQVYLEVEEVLKNTTKRGSGFDQLKEIFRSRVMDYFKDHENDDVPEGELPWLFHKPKQEPELNMNKSPESLATSAPPIKEAVCFEAVAASTPSDLASTPAKTTPSMPTKLASTPAEFTSTPARLMADTPALRTPKRALASDDDDASNLPNKSAKRRSLKFEESSVDIDDPLGRVDEEESDVPAQVSSISKDDVLEILPEELLQSLKEKERKNLEEKDPIMVQEKNRQKLMAGVPKLFDMIYLLFQSLGRSVIRKEELVYKLVTGHMGFIDKNEVEDQLKLLQEIAPEYISEQPSLSGDTLVRRNKFSCVDSIRAKLHKAR